MRRLTAHKPWVSLGFRLTQEQCPRCSCMLPGKDVNPGQYLGHEELWGEPGVEAEEWEGQASSWATRGKPRGLPHGGAEVELSQQKEEPWPWPRHTEHPWATPAHTSWLTPMTQQWRRHTSFKIKTETIPKENSQCILPSHSETALVGSLNLDTLIAQKQWFRSSYPAFCHEWKGKHEREMKTDKENEDHCLCFHSEYLYTHTEEGREFILDREPIF